MPCLKCQGKLTWEDRSWTTAGEDPGHWRCINCGNVIYSGRAGGQIPDSEEKEEDEMRRTDQGKECSREECKRHGQILPYTEFSKNKANRDGYEYHCKQCKAGLAAALRERKAREVGGGKRIETRRTRSRPQNPGPLAVKAPLINGLDAQLAIDLKQMKRRIAKEVLEIYRAGGEKAVDEAFS